MSPYHRRYTGEFIKTPGYIKLMNPGDRMTRKETYLLMVVREHLSRTLLEEATSGTTPQGEDDIDPQKIARLHDISHRKLANFVKRYPPSTETVEEAGELIERYQSQKIDK